MEDLIGNYLCDEENWKALKAHEQRVARWKAEAEERIESRRFKKRRSEQYQSILDNEHVYRFVTTRVQTRYKQQNYQKTAYKASVPGSEISVSYSWLVCRHEKLAEKGFEATLKEFHSKNQRRLMAKERRERIKERDNYTCQICGKYMPDEVGLHIDHIIPVSKGGKSVESNLRVLCSKCNGMKSKYDPK